MINSTDPSQKTNKRGNNYEFFLWSIGILVISVFAIYFYWEILVTNGEVPWGSDTFGHIYRFDYLHNSLKNGIFYPDIYSDWYLGIQLLRYYPPLVYYLLALSNFIFSDPIQLVNIFLFVFSWVGGISWLFYKRWIGWVPAIIGGCLYMIMPDLLRVAFSEGNLLRHFTNALIPITFFLTLFSFKTKHIGGHTFGIGVVFSLLVLGHPMMAAIIASLSAILLLFAWMHKLIAFRRLSKIFLGIILGILSAAWWLFPSLTGGITELNAAAIIQGLPVVSLLSLINPMTRIRNPESLYLGLGLGLSH